MAQGTDPVTGRTADVRIDTTRTSNDPEAIADDIRETRAEMDETIDALSAKLDPSNLIDQAKEAFTSSAKDAGTSMMDQLKDSSVLDTIKANPIPAAAVGLSLAWLLSKMGENESEKYRYERYQATGDPYYAPRRPRYAAGYAAGYSSDPSYGGMGYGDTYAPRTTGPAGSANYGGGSDESIKDKASDALDTAKDKASDVVDAVKDKASDLASGTRDMASGAADGTRHFAHDTGRQFQGAQRQAGSWLDHQMTANPLAVGAVALAAGALVGLSIPETNVEHQAFGDQADQVKGQLGSAAADKVDQVRDAAQEVTSEIRDKAKSVADEAKAKGQDVADSATDKAKSVADDAKGAADKAAEEAKDKASDAGSSSGSRTMGGGTSSGSKEASGTTGGGTTGGSTASGSVTGGAAAIGTPTTRPTTGGSTSGSATTGGTKPGSTAGGSSSGGSSNK